MFENILVQFTLLLGFAACVAMVVNVLKFFGLVKDDSAEKWVQAFNLIGILALYVLKILKPNFDVGPIDATLAEAAMVGNYILSVVIGIFGSKFTYTQIKGLPVIGYSHSGKQVMKLPKA